jgi:hypothetical protein
MDKRDSLCHGPVGTTGEYRSEAAEIEEIAPSGQESEGEFGDALVLDKHKSTPAAQTSPR